MTTTTIERQFQFNDSLLPDPNPSITPENVMQHYSNIYPELTNATLVNKGLQQNGNQKFVFESIIGKKG